MPENPTPQELEERFLFPTYARYPLRVAGGRGNYLIGEDRREYLDCFGGIAVNSLGYGHPRLQAVVRQAADYPFHLSNFLGHPWQGPLAAKLCAVTGMKRVFYTNTGTEAMEAAIKITRARTRKAGKPGKIGLVSLKDSFHGRSCGSLSLTAQEKYRTLFEPLLPAVRYAEATPAGIESAVDDTTAALFIEPVQGEGGVRPLSRELLECARKTCDRHDALLVFDEIQCGFGRTGSWFRFQAMGVTPDLLCIAKPIAAGIPMGACLGGPRVEGALALGEHGSTFAGGPLPCRLALEVLSIIEEEGLVARAASLGERLRAGLERVAKTTGRITEVRGAGLMIGADLTTEAKGFVRALLKEGIVTGTAGTNTLRILPPLTLREEEADTFLAVLERTLAAM